MQNKKIILSAILTFFIMTGSKSEASPIIVDTSTRLELLIDEPIISLSVRYPGPDLSGICGLELKTQGFMNQSAQALLDAIEITDVLGATPILKKINYHRLLVDLTPSLGHYLVNFSIRTKDGTTLKETIESTLGQGVTVTLLTRLCPQ